LRAAIQKTKAERSPPRGGAGFPATWRFSFTLNKIASKIARVIRRVGDVFE
jgi:hypothetical protein